MKWHINWQNEHSFVRNPAWQKAVDQDGCWVDYATVFYWYQSVPDGFEHQPLPPVADRMKLMLHPVSYPPGFRAAFMRMPVDPNLENKFDVKEDLGRVLFENMYPNTHPFWIDNPESKGGHPGNPNPGKQGIVGLHAKDANQPGTLIRKVALPANKKSTLRLVVSGDPFEAPGKSDFLIQAGVFDGRYITWFDEKTIDAGVSPAVENWQILEYPLHDYASKTIGILVKVSYGGKEPGLNEEAFCDEISVVHD